MCLNTETPKTMNFQFIPNRKLMCLRCPNVSAHQDMKNVQNISKVTQLDMWQSVLLIMLIMFLELTLVQAVLCI